MTIIGARKITYSVSGTLVVLSFLALALWGLRLGIDFTGGSLLEVEFRAVSPPLGGETAKSRPTNEEIALSLREAGIENIVIQPTGERGVILRMKDLAESDHQKVIAGLGKLGELQEKRFDSIGPTIGEELRRKSVWAIVLVLVMIVAYISWAFRGVSPPAGRAGRPMASWKYGVAAIVALTHDVAIPTGVFSALGRFYGVEVDTLFVTALLTILGFSVHDTIVVFDRIRENLNKSGGRDFEAVVEQSIKDTVARSINTSLTVMLVMLALYFFGGATTQYFSLAIIIGVFFGTYSSIFVASALLVSWYKWSLKRA